MIETIDNKAKQSHSTKRTCEWSRLNLIDNVILAKEESDIDTKDGEKSIIVKQSHLELNLVNDGKQTTFSRRSVELSNKLCQKDSPGLKVLNFIESE